MHNLATLTAVYDSPTAVDLGFVVNLKTLRETLRTLNVDGRRWWIASDPHDAIDQGYVTVGHGDENCVDRLNTVSFRVKVLSKEPPWGGPDQILMLFDASSIAADGAGFYLDKDDIVQDELEDFMCFFRPVKAALIKRMQSGM